MRWWGWWKSDKDPEPVLEPAPKAEERRQSITAMLDGAIRQFEEEQAASNQAAQTASKKATNASRKVIMRTGQFPAAPALPTPESEKD